MSNFLVGAHGTGKSSILELAKERRTKMFFEAELLENYFITEGVSRPIIRGLQESQIEVTDIQRQVLINELTTSQYLVQIQNKNTLCTRSILDIIAYSRLYPQIDIKKYCSVFSSTLPSINNLFYTPIEFKLETDSERKGIWSDEQIQKEIDLSLQSLLEQAAGVIQGSVVTLTGTVEERLKKMIKYL